MLEERQESNLTSGGDCFEHWHSADRVITHDDWSKLNSLVLVTPVAVNTVITDKSDVVLADTSLSNLTITLPVAASGREIQIVKNALQNRLSIMTSGTNTIFGANEVRVYNYGTSLRFKAVTNGWVIL